MTWIDMHCHPTDPRWNGAWPDVRARAEAAGVTRFVCGGVDPEEWAKQRDLQDLVRCCGLHPYYVATHDDATCDQALQALAPALVDAPFIGEIGIDKRPEYWSEPQAARQCTFMERQLDLAVQMQKVPVYHVVRGHDVLQPAIKQRPGLRGGIVHGFVGNPQTARFYLDHGCCLSIGRHLLKGHAGLREVVALAPLDRLLVESDAPDGSLDGTLNEPSQVVPIAEAICQIKGVDSERFAYELRRSFEILVSPQTG